MFYVIDFCQPFKGQSDQEAKVKKVAARVVATAADMGVRAHDISVGSNLKISHEGCLNVGKFIKMVYQHVDEVEAEIVQ